MGKYATDPKKFISTSSLMMFTSQVSRLTYSQRFFIWSVQAVKRSHSYYTINVNFLLGSQAPIVVLSLPYLHDYDPKGADILLQFIQARSNPAQPPSACNGMVKKTENKTNNANW